MQRAGLLLAFIAACALGSPSSVSAHAFLESSIPRANATTVQPPTRIVLRFTEPVDPAFSSVRITDATGTAIRAQTAVSADGRVLAATVDPLPEGVYTVRWRVLSTLDGHPSSGFYLFGVGQNVPAGLGGRETEPVGPVGTAVRWLAFAAAAVLVGGVVFQAAVLRPAFASISPEEARRATAVLEASRPAAASALIVGTGLDFLSQAGTLLGISWRQVLAGGALWGLLAATRLGWSALIRIGMALVFLLPSSPQGLILRAGALVWMLIVGGVVAAFGGPSAVTGTMLVPIILTAAVYGIIAIMLPLVAGQTFGPLRFGERWVLSLAGATLMLGFSVTSHAAGSGPLAMVADWVHLVAVAGWIGGLLALLLVLASSAHPGRADLARALVPRMSRLAGAGLAAAVVTGAYSSILQVPAVQAFVSTPYGRLLIAKLVLVTMAAALGAANRYLMRPRLESSNPTPLLLRRFTYTVSGEVGIAAVIMAIVAVLTVMPPAATTWKPVTAQKMLRLAGLADGVRVDLAIAPAQPGWNRFEAVAADKDGRPLGGDLRMLLRLTKLDEPLDPVLVSLQDQGGGLFLAEETGLGLPGWWEVEVIVRRRGRLDVSTSFPLRLGDGKARTRGPSGSELLEAMASTMFQLGSWREDQQITDGAGNVARSWFELVHPDRLRYRTSGGTEAVIIGQTQYLRVNGGPWQTLTLPNAFSVNNYLRSYIDSPQEVVRGREAPCDDERCAVVLWEAPSASAAFAAWVGLRTSRMHKLLMIAPSHYMTSRLTDFDADLHIRPPR